MIEKLSLPGQIENWIYIFDLKNVNLLSLPLKVYFKKFYFNNNSKKNYFFFKITTLKKKFIINFHD